MSAPSCAPLGSPQPVYTVPDVVADTAADAPVPGPTPAALGPLALPALVLGAATLSAAYNDDTVLATDVPLRTVRLALRYGITSFDTSAYYGVSEIILGQLLQDPRIANEFPRASYKITTKCGRYGFKCSQFDYSPSTIRASVQRSLKRLGTDYLDVVLLHDVEFVAEVVAPPAGTAGDHAAILENPDLALKWGLSPDKADEIYGPGDLLVLEAAKELFRLKEEGVVKAVGISGYPLPTLLRLARLISARIQPLDTMLSYSNYNLQNAVFAKYAPHFLATGIRQLSSASPFSMGLLTPKPPSWHPAPEPIHDIVKRSSELIEKAGLEGGMPSLALGFSLRRTQGDATLATVPSVVGLSSLHEVHETIRVWREVNGEVDPTKDELRRKLEQDVRESFKNEGWDGWCWPSPPPEAL